tara:strand:- start:3523 stop:3921 length:399 start_codon:yes stop_codon:yes gene_type:complete
MSGWWALWVIANIGGSISYRLGMRAETLEDYLMVGYLDLVVLPLEAFAAVLYLKIIRGITNNQEAASATVVEREGEESFSSHANSDGNGAQSDSGNGVPAQESRFPSTDGRDFESRFPSSNQEDPYGSRPRE